MLWNRVGARILAKVYCVTDIYHIEKRDIGLQDEDKKLCNLADYTGWMADKNKKSKTGRFISPFLSTKTIFRMMP
jgi:hypothetical protein